MAVIDAIVLAAGASSRTRPVHKLTADLGGKPVILWVLDAIAPCVRDVVVVTAGDAAVEVVVGDRARVVRNLRAEDGMSTSLVTGLAALRPGADGVLQALGDMPLVREADVRLLLAAARPDRVVVPLHDGFRGHPVVWGSASLPVLRALDAATTARDLLEAGRLAVIEVPIDDDGVLFDVDTPEALSEARDRVSRRS